MKSAKIPLVSVIDVARTGVGTRTSLTPVV
jgi:hypothetical protein